MRLESKKKIQTSRKNEVHYRMKKLTSAIFSQRRSCKKCIIYLGEKKKKNLVCFILLRYFSESTDINVTFYYRWIRDILVVYMMLIL